MFIKSELEVLITEFRDERRDSSKRVYEVRNRQGGQSGPRLQRQIQGVWIRRIHPPK